MPTPLRRPVDPFARSSATVHIRLPRVADAGTFIAAAKASRKLHGSWVHPPTTKRAFRTYVSRFADDVLRDRLQARHAGFLVWRRDTGALVGTFSFGEIIRGALKSAFLGYYAFEGQAGRGLMREGLCLSLDQAFGVLKLHRVEVNVQPSNTRSIALVEAAGFAQEGYSPRYVKVAGRWRDHLRFAMLADDWRLQRRRA